MICNRSVRKPPLSSRAWILKNRLVFRSARAQASRFRAPAGRARRTRGGSTPLGAGASGRRGGTRSPRTRENAGPACPRRPGRCACSRASRGERCNARHNQQRTASASLSSNRRKPVVAREPFEVLLVAIKMFAVGAPKSTRLFLWKLHPITNYCKSFAGHEMSPVGGRLLAYCKMGSPRLTGTHGDLLNANRRWRARKCLRCVVVFGNS